MKKLLLLLLFFVTSTINAQIVNIPDANFKAKLLEASPSNEIAKDLNDIFFKIDANDDGEIQEDEALAVSYLNISLNYLISDLTGIEEFINLEYLNGNNNDFSVLNFSQNINLTYLDLSENSILDNIDLTQNINLEYLRVNGTNFDVLNFSQNTNLTYLDVSENVSLTIIDLTQNVNLEYLNCEETYFSSLDITQNVNLKTLICHSSGFANLDVTQNVNLEYLGCAGTNLDSLDVTQNSLLQFLQCNAHDISYLDVSNNPMLETLICSDLVLLTELDISQNPNLQYLDCSDNISLFNLNLKNGVNETLNMANNISLINVCADEDQLPDVLAQVSSTAVVSSYCGFVPGGDYNTIFGDVRFDALNDGCDTNDLPALYVRIDINDGTEQGSAFVNNSGVYSFYTQSGNFELTPYIENPTWFNISPEIVSIRFTNNENNEVVQNFCVTANGIHNDVEIIIVPIIPAQPGFDALYQIVYRNKGNQTLSGDINFTFNDAVLDYVSASAAPSNQTTDNVTWDYIDLLPFESRSLTVTLNVNSPTETPAVNIGDELPFVATINPIAGDETPSDNEFQFKQTVIGSYDPNDKTCLEGDTVTPDQIGEYLHYNINFENTGTAAATFVVVKDIIDETKFDINTLQVMYASHEMVTTVTGNKVEFIFDTINLGPDEKGNVVFKIKTLETLTVGDSVTNEAEIYFDYNFPIVTNVTNTTFQTLSVDEFSVTNTVSVYPNPTTGELNIKTQAPIVSVNMYDVQGRAVLPKSIGENSTSINISGLTKGIYFLKIKTELGETIEKVIKR